MARRKTTTATLDLLTPREGKVLRYFVGRKARGETQTATDDCIVETEWSDLPHSHFQALAAVQNLIDYGLLLRVDLELYTPTPAGTKLIAAANAAKMWQAAPRPSVTNNAQHISNVLTDFKPKRAATKPAAKPKPKAKPKAPPKPKPKAKPKAKGQIHIRKARP